MWTTKYVPTKSDDLCVYKKRIDECRDWMIRTSNRSEDRVLVVSGPPGCGKTTMIRLLANELRLRVRDIGSDAIGFEDGRSSGKRKIDSEVSKIKKELFQSMRYRSLRMNAHEKEFEFVLIDNIPHFQDRDEFEEFGSIIRTFVNDTNSCARLILVVTETSPSEEEEEERNRSRLLRQSGDVKSLLTSDVLNNYRTTHLKLVAVSDTKMRKALRRIASRVVRSKPTESDIEDIVSSAGGDMRHAAHCLQWCSVSASKSISSDGSLFSFLRRDRESSSSFSKKKKKRKRATSDGSFENNKRKKKSNIKTSSSSSSSSYARNLCLQPFHAVAKLLYAKRLEKTDEDDDEGLPPLDFVPEDVVERCGLSSSKCLDFVHRNYTEFYNDITDASETLSYFSDADVLQSYGMRYPTRKDQSFPNRYVASVASRTVATNNRDPAKKTFRQITGPRSGGIFAATRSNRKQHQKWMSRYFEETMSAHHIAGDISTIEILPTLQKVCSRDLRRASTLGFNQTDIQTMNQVTLYSKPFQTRDIGKRNQSSGILCGEWVSGFKEAAFNYCTTLKKKAFVGDRDYDDDPIEPVLD